MNARWLAGAVALSVLVLGPKATGASGLGVEVWTDRGDDAVYQPGQALEIEARTSDDAYLLVYEIDPEGQVHLLYPYRGSTGFVEGRRTYPVPPERSNVDLVVQGPVGQCYVVAIASRDPFLELPWYLRPYDMQAAEVGYEGTRDDEEGITAEGRIVGDPFVAMERIRRRVLNDPQDPDAFGTSYATYYVHNEVRYPRYLCYDCHRTGQWAWWPGFDPYYTSCSVIDFRVNWGWGWGPGYWFGSVPYYNYVFRYDCPPRYRPWYQNRARFSSWDGWRRWNSMWGNRLVRYKSDPPAGYVAPSKFRDRGVKPTPPGFFASDVRKGREGLRPKMITGRGYQTRPRETVPREEATAGRRLGTGTGRPTAERMPSREVIGDREGGRRPEGGAESRERVVRPLPRQETPRYDRPRQETPRYHRPRQETPRYDRPRQEAPRYERPRQEQPRGERSPRYEKPRDERPAEKSRDERPEEKPRDHQRGDPGRSSDAPRGHRTKG